MHQCVGQHLAWPLIYEVVRQVLLLPGLAQKIQSDVSDPDDEPSEPNEKIESESGEPAPLKKSWGAICEAYMLFHQRDRRLNQQPLFVVLPIKEPVKGKRRETARSADASRCPHCRSRRLREIQGSCTLPGSCSVENGTHLALSTVYDGDFDALRRALCEQGRRYLTSSSSSSRSKQPTPITSASEGVR